MENINLPKADVLSGVKILEFSAIGPVPWGVHELARMGAQVTRVQPPGRSAALSPDADGITDFGRHSLCLDLKTEAGRDQVRQLIKSHDVLVEGMRPNVMERLGLSPAICHGINPKLVYARVTGWGQNGPLAERAGHDINYIALSGALHAIGPKCGPPAIPLNLLADYGGGGTFMVIGILGGLFKASMTGQGSIVDVSMLDGATHLMARHFEHLGAGEWVDQREMNRLDGGAPWYSIYRARCGRYLAVGAIEPQFYSIFIKGLELDEASLPSREERENWPLLRQIFAQCFLGRTRNAWAEIFEPLDACVTPVLSMKEALEHPHNVDRKVFLRMNGGRIFVNNAPRFSPMIDM